MADRLPPTDRPFTLTIKRQHFVKAVTNSATRCLIAQALYDTFPDLAEAPARLGIESTMAYFLNQWWRHDGYEVVCAFDQGRLRRATLPQHPVRVTFAPKGDTRPRMYD